MSTSLSSKVAALPIGRYHSLKDKCLSCITTRRGDRSEVALAASLAGRLLSLSKTAHEEHTQTATIKECPSRLLS